MKCEEAGCYEAAIISVRKDLFGKSDAMRHLCSHHAPRWLAVSGQVNEKAIGGSDVCHTCAAHVKVITEDLEPRIRALEAELAVEKMQHSVTIAEEHESRTAFQDGIRAIEAELIGEMKLRQTAEAYAARNALRVIAVEAALRKHMDHHDGCESNDWSNESDWVVTSFGFVLKSDECSCGANQLALSLDPLAKAIVDGYELETPSSPTAQHASECPKLYGGECDCNPTELETKDE